MTIENNLQNLGFSENEAKVYFALLDIGFSTTGPIIKQTGLHRNIVYETLDKLLARQLASLTIQRGKKHFRAMSPAKILKEQTEQFYLAQKIVPELIKKQKQEKQEVIVYEGIDGFHNAHFDAVDQMAKNSAIYVLIAGGQKWYQIMDKALKKFDQKRVEKNITDKIIALESQRQNIKLQAKRTLFEVKFLPEQFNAPSGAAVYGDITLIMVYGDPTFIVMIKNSQVALGFKQYFEILWKMAKE